MNLFGAELDLNLWRRRKVALEMTRDEGACGLACLAMVGSAYGYRTDVSAMKDRHRVSLRGTSLTALIDAAGQLGFMARPLKVELDALRSVRTPCILHWDLNHYVVLCGFKGQRAIIHDPAMGRRLLSADEVSLHFTGVLLELSPGPNFVARDERRPYTFRTLTGAIPGVRSGLAQLFAIGIALQLLVMLGPFLLQWVVDEALPTADVELVSTLAVGFVILVLFQTALTALRGWALAMLSATFNFQWLGNVFAQLMRLPLPFFSCRQLGDIVSRFGSIQHVQRAVSAQVVEAVIDGLLVITTLALMVLYNPALTTISVVAVALYAGLRVVLVRPMLAATMEHIAFDAKQQGHLYESIQGIQTVRLFGRGESRRIGWMNVLAEQTNARLQLGRLGVLRGSASVLLFGVERVVVIWAGARMAIHGDMSVGMLVGFAAYREQFIARVSSLIDTVADLRQLAMHTQRIADVMTATPEPSLAAPATPLRSASIELRDVSFRYGGINAPVLDRCNAFIQDGESVALTGPSGGGKTTLVKLILGLLTPTSGEILVGGVPVAQLGADNVRAIVGSVMQDDVVFSGSIRDNITFFDPQADDARLQDAAHRACIGDEIEALPMGYHTFITADGHGLSGGQLQRVLLARALYKQPRILILDEATSHLDIANERRVNAGIEATPLTRVIVAHRPETIAMATRVLLLDAGQINETAAPTVRHSEAQFRRPQRLAGAGV